LIELSDTEAALWAEELAADDRRRGVTASVIQIDLADPLRSFRRAAGLSGRALAGLRDAWRVARGAKRRMSQPAHLKDEQRGAGVSLRALQESAAAAGYTLELRVGDGRWRPVRPGIEVSVRDLGATLADAEAEFGLRAVRAG
jgi:hypothetical protein